MAEKAIIWSRTADVQFTRTLEYWNTRNKSTRYSQKLVNQVSDLLQFIAKSPLAAPLTDFQENRVATLGNYSIYYRILDEAIFISAFWDNRQDPGQLLEALGRKP